jgi:Fe-S-cluster containining protein
MNAELREQVLQVYAEVDAVVAAASPKCDASGRCCRFTEYDHTLFLSQFEAEILLETAPPFAKPISRDGCPFQVNNLCTARVERPLGCRIYFCDPAFQEPQYAITEAAIRRLKQLADQFETGWRYAPLHHFLNDSIRPQDAAVLNAEPVAVARMSLPVI